LALVAALSGCSASDDPSACKSLDEFARATDRAVTADAIQESDDSAAELQNARDALDDAVADMPSDVASAVRAIDVFGDTQQSLEASDAALVIANDWIEENCGRSGFF
jgi:hypothetical protein